MQKEIENKSEVGTKTRDLGRRVARYLRAADILGETRATNEEYAGGLYGVRLRLVGIREKSLCDMIAVAINETIDKCAKVTLQRSREIFNEGIDGAL